MILPGVVVEKCRQIDAVDIVQRSDGLRLTSPSRTLFDCADILGTKRTISIFEQLIDEKKATFVTRAATVARLGRPGRPGARMMSAVVASRPAWRAGLQSHLEVMVLEAIEHAGLVTPETPMWFVLRAANESDSTSRGRSSRSRSRSTIRSGMPAPQSQIATSAET